MGLGSPPRIEHGKHNIHYNAYERACRSRHEVTFLETQALIEGARLSPGTRNAVGIRRSGCRMMYARVESVSEHEQRNTTVDCFGIAPETRATLITVTVMGSIITAFCAPALRSAIGEKRFNPWKTIRGLGLTALALAVPGTFFTFYIWTVVRNHNQGTIRQIYPVTVDGRLRFGVWLTRVRSMKVGAHYTHILRTYDADAGTQFGMIRISARHYDDDYRIYPPAGRRAWAYGAKEGLKLLDLAEPRIIANEDTLVERLAVLGGAVRFSRVRCPHDPATNSVLLRAPDGGLLRVDDTLGAKPVGGDACDAATEGTRIPWQLIRARGSEGYLVRSLKSGSVSTKPEMLHPEFIEELTDCPPHLDKVWVAHKSTLFGDFVWLATCFDSAGRELNTIDLGAISGRADVLPIAVMSRNHETLLLVSGLAATHVVKQPVTLVGLRVEPLTAQVKGCVRYF